MTEVTKKVRRWMLACALIVTLRSCDGRLLSSDGALRKHCKGREGSQTAGQWVLGVLGEGRQVLSDGAPGLSLTNRARAAAANREDRACHAMATSTR